MLGVGIGAEGTLGVKALHLSGLLWHWDVCYAHQWCHVFAEVWYTQFLTDSVAVKKGSILDAVLFDRVPLGIVLG